MEKVQFADLTPMPLDVLMTARGIGTLIVPMHEAMHASFRWLTRGAKVTRGYVVKRAGREPFLIAYPMERDEAAATGVAVRSIHDFGHEAIFRSAATSVDAYARFFDAVLRDTGSEGPVAFSGNAPIALYLGIAETLRRNGWVVHSGGGEDLIQLARKQKDDREIAAIRSVGQRTEAIVDMVRAELREWREGMRVGDLKALVSQEITRRGMVEDHETILSHGRDAGVPHSRGDGAQLIRPSVPIVIDIFPADRTTGYFFDLTRTFCVGDVPERLQKVHSDVLAAFELAADRMKPGTPASSYQALVCDYFEKRGYRTTRSHSSTSDGYVHSLGHGVGLDIHEKPSFSLSDSNHDVVEEGDVLTIEPGLYFPDEEIGVRIEDTFVVRRDCVEPLSHGSRALQP
ncbi:MAG TPA: Xaa-Pro peptidase family protein [Thermoanaerobaculia bacterium]|nr:Xaa-Pro peptidase family protein [Thermoanaerobaculia bacterium]